MAGPPTSAFGEIRWQFSGANIPTGRAQYAIGVSGPADAEAILDVAQLHWDEIKVYMAFGITLDQIALKVGPVSTGPTYVRPVGEPGTSGEAMVPPNTAVLVRKTLQGISGRYAGRMFVPGMLEGYVNSNGTLSTELLTGLQAVFDSLQFELGAVADPVVFPNTGADARSVVSLDVQSRVATQRRRLRR